MPSALIRRAAASLAVAASLGTASPASANPFSILRAASKAGQVAKGAGAVGKASKAAGAAGKAATVTKLSAAGKAIVAGGSVVAAERAGLLFAGLGDDGARLATYVAREPDGLLRTVVAGGEQATLTVDDAARSISAMAAERGAAGADVYVDLSAARVPGAIPPPQPGQRLYVLDAEAKPHRLTSTKTEQGYEYEVELDDGVLDVADFAASQLEDDGEGESDMPPWFPASVLGVGAIGYAIHRRKRRQAETPADAG
jgi:hypothetical protein